MKIKSYQSKEDWLTDRRGKITGMGLGDVVPKTDLTKDDLVAELEMSETPFKKTMKKDELESLIAPELLSEMKLLKRMAQPKKIGFYELIADKIAIAPDDENPMERGLRLEPETLERYTKETGTKLETDLVMWMRDDNENIAVSPDGYKKDLTMAVDAKSLSNAKHVKAYLTQELPDDYEFQKIQYFIVNDKLKTLHFAFYNPRIPYFDFFILTFHRKDMKDEIDGYLLFEKNILKEVDEIVNNITF